MERTICWRFTSICLKTKYSNWKESRNVYRLNLPRNEPFLLRAQKRMLLGTHFISHKSTKNVEKAEAKSHKYYANKALFSKYIDSFSLFTFTFIFHVSPFKSPLSLLPRNTFIRGLPLPPCLPFQPHSIATITTLSNSPVWNSILPITIL